MFLFFLVDNLIINHYSRFSVCFIGIICSVAYFVIRVLNDYLLTYATAEL